MVTLLTEYGTTLPIVVELTATTAARNLPLWN